MKIKGLPVLVICLLAAAYLAFGGGLNIPWPVPGPVTPTKPPLIVMLYEDSHGNLPSYAIGAANELTAAGREVRPVDDDVTTGLDEVPTWLKPALAPGRAIMGGTDDAQQKDDALILLDGERVVKAVKLPATKAEILEAVK